MLIEVGDKVRFLNDIGEGIVVKILNKNQVIIRDNNDFELPMFNKELVIVEKSKKNTNIENKVKATIPQEVLKEEKPKKIELKTDNTTKILLCFVRKQDSTFDGFECYLVNDSNYFIFYNLVLYNDFKYEHFDAECLEPNTKIFVDKLSRLQINTIKEIVAQIIFYKHPNNILRTPIEKRIKIVPLNFYQDHLFESNDFLNDKAFIFKLFEDNRTKEEFNNQTLIIEKIIKEDDLLESKTDKTHRYNARALPIVKEIDLHINQLVDSVIGMSNSDIVQKQMSVFHNAMLEAIENKISKLIIIHGIGNGTLKQLIRDSIEQQYKLVYEDASYKEYGFGATMVIF